MIDLTHFVPREIHGDLAWLGRIDDWTKITPIQGVNEKYVRSVVEADWDRIESQPGFADHQRFVQRIANHATASFLSSTESLACLIANGPKAFRPTAEQFDSMEHVELWIPPGDFRQPYPALVIEIPSESRRRLSIEHQWPMDKMPQVVLLRCIQRPGLLYAHVVIKVPGTEFEEHYIFSDHPSNPTIEDVLRRYIINGEVTDGRNLTDLDALLKPLALAIARSCLNLCLMLTHYGCRTAGPIDPVAYKKHRTKKHLEHFKYGDFLAVEMVQNIIVRDKASPTLNPLGPGTGIEMRPHWRRGHWRCYPGCAVKRAAGEKVPLLFVRPCLIRPDRVVGDLAASEATYHGGHNEGHHSPTVAARDCQGASR